MKAFAPKEWLNHSNKIDHRFKKKLEQAKKEAIQRVLVHRNEEYKQNELEKVAIAHGLCSDNDYCSK